MLIVVLGEINPIGLLVGIAISFLIVNQVERWIVFPWM
jgi:hypothetical protein